MPDSIFILKNPPLEDSQNFTLLREVGISHIEKLAHEIWTDYNAHDPGITILEALCYAITDLGFRTNYDMKDLLTEEVNGLRQNNSNFHTARHIFTNNPATFNDLRKWLIDIDGVRNAWISKNKDIKYCLDKQERLNAKLINICTPGVSTHESLEPLNGLYDILLQYEDYVEEDDRIARLGIMSESSADLLPANFITPGLEGIEFKVYYPASLHTVYVYPDSTNLGNDENLQIQLYEKDETGAFSMLKNELTKRLDTDAEKQKTQIILDFEVEAGKTYLLTAKNSTVKLHHRPNSSIAHSGFPYQLFSVIELVNGFNSSPNGNYYFFYDWEINYAVSPYSREVQKTIGLKDYTTPPSQLLKPNGHGLAFEIFSHLTLRSVDVYAEANENFGDKDITIRLLKLVEDNAEEVYTFTTQVNVFGEVNTIELNWEIAPSSSYKLEAISNIPLRTNSNITYPMELSQVISIKNGLINYDTPDDKYYFFYNWHISYSPQSPQVSSLTRQDVKKAVIERVHPVRNLCEDLITLRELETEDIGVCANIGVRIDTDLEEILAEIFYRLELHVSPPVSFYTIEELKTKGKTTDEIFEGPILDHGFIDNDEFRQLERRCYLRASDIYQIIMDVPGVETIKELSLLSFVKVTTSNLVNVGDQVVTYTEDNIPVQYKFKQEPWILNLQAETFFAPDFRPDRSKLIFFKNGLPYLPNVSRAIDLYEEKRTANIRNRIRGHAKDLPIPLGEEKELEVYYPFQNDLPETYRTGQNRVTRSASELRKAQSKQLKSYLLFFDQILANYLSQLAHIKELFSWETDATQTYFTQALGDIAQLDELYIDSPNLQSNLVDLVQNKKIDEIRKNRFLDHLMGRFCEDFTDYSLMMYSLYKERAAQTVIRDKQCFLQDYPLLSSQRGKAYDYRNGEGITGFHRRMYRLLGIRQDNECKIGWQQFASDRIRIAEITGASNSGQYQIQLMDSSGLKVLFSSNPAENCGSKIQACALLDNLIPFIAASIIHVNENTEDTKDWIFKDGRWELHQKCRNGQTSDSVIGYADSDIFSDDGLKTKYKIQAQIIDYFTQYAYREGFHLIEHIMLRKRTAESLENLLAISDIESILGEERLNELKNLKLTDFFLPVELNTDDDCDCVEVRDPYSFRATAILPSWPERFQRTRFRQYVETLLRLETPAHIYLKICWISHCEMQEFEACYWEWLARHAALPRIYSGILPLPSTDSLEGEIREQLIKYAAALIKLINKMHSLTTIFPTARLHDCQDDNDSGEPPITLNNVSLGSL